MWTSSADGKYEVSYKPNVVIFSNGEVLWIPPAIYKSSCTIDVQYFPFDQQECVMKFGSWTFNGDQVSQQYHCTSCYSGTAYSIYSNEYKLQEGKLFRYFGSRSRQCRGVLTFCADCREIKCRPWAGKIRLLGPNHNQACSQTTPIAAAKILGAIVIRDTCSQLTWKSHSPYIHTGALFDLP